MNENEINDVRILSDFKNITFSEFSRSNVKKELFKSIKNTDIEPACYWSIELICAGHFNDVWNIIIHYYSRYIHTSNPKLPIYLSRRFELFKNIINSGYHNNEVSLRNNDTIRRLFAEIISIITYSKKAHTFEDYNIKTDHDFDIIKINYRLKAPEISYANKIFNNNDPKEIFIAINEFMFNISHESKDTVSACYWLEWIIKFDYMSKQNKAICECERRTFPNVENKYQMNIIWMIWEGLLIQVENKKNYYNIINALLSLFCIKYKPSYNRTRKYLLYSAITFVTEEINFNSPLIMSNNNNIKNITNNINIIYKQVKRNEKTPNTDYLFDGIKENNIDKSIKKIEAMNAILDNYTS